MIISIVSNFLNHHQLMLCNEFGKYCDEFYFIATEKIPEDRLSMGYSNMDSQYDFVLRTYDGSVDNEKIYDVLCRSDAVIFGACPDELIEYRMKQNKLSFLASERFFKKGTWRRFHPSVAKAVKRRSVQFKDKEYYVLCASAFLSWDLSLLGFPEEKCYKWGYFPKVERLDKYPEKNKDKLKILWVGRLLELKRGDMAVKACACLKKENIDFSLDFIGDGQCKDKLISLCNKYGIDENVNFLGSMSPEEVRENMKNADIFMFTSNFREGWGAVVNEAMSCGCAMLVSSAAGSVPFLIDDGKNGFIFRNGCQADMDKKLLKLALSSEMRETLGKNAMNAINNEYCPEVAAKRLVEFIKAKDKSKVYFAKGPMSKAKIIKNKWYK